MTISGREHVFYLLLNVRFSLDFTWKEISEIWNCFLCHHSAFRFFQNIIKEMQRVMVGDRKV